MSGSDDHSSDTTGMPQLPDIAGIGDIADAAKASKSKDVQVEFDDAAPAPVPKKDASKPSLPAFDPLAADAAAEQPAASAPGPGEESHIGRDFGGYQIVSKIGQGGMGVVYKGRQISLDRVVAIKILSKSLCENDEFIKRFEREAKSIGRINHTNIVAVYDFGQKDGVWYMVNEFIEGTTLAKRIGENMLLPVEEVIPIITQCLTGLAFVNQSGIVHRDIKPDNILLTKDKIAKIADFGLAKDVKNDDSDLTAVGLAMGTPAYMSPEQCMGRRLDVRSDMYALGVTAYYALTGEKPFTGGSSFDIMTKQREYLPPPPDKLNPRIPKDVSSLIMRMIAKTPGDRYATAEQCRDAWNEVGAKLSGGTVLATPEKPVAPELPSGLKLAPVPPSPAVVEPQPPSPEKRPTTEKSIQDRGTEATTTRGGTTERQRSTTEKRVSVRTSTAEAVTCPRCGMLNRGDVKECQRCGTQFQKASPQSLKELENEATEFFARGRFKEAADRYSRMADQETDRKQRSIWRSKEREARTRIQEAQLAELNNRTTLHLGRGDLKAGLEVLEKGLNEVRSTGASTDTMETHLLQQITVLRQRLGWRRRLKGVIVILLLVLAAIIGWIVWQRMHSHQPQRISRLLRHSPAHHPAAMPVAGNDVRCWRLS